MNGFAFDVKNDPAYKFGTHIGFLAGFLLFASVLYLVLNFTKKLPKAVEYYHIIMLVAIIYLVGYVFLKLRK